MQSIARIDNTFKTEKYVRILQGGSQSLLLANRLTNTVMMLY